jgi:hypothetical protein
MKYAKLLDGYIVQIIESNIDQIGFTKIDFEIPQSPGLEYKFNYSKREWEDCDIEQKIIIAQQRILSNRQELLLSSDWTQIPNGPLTQQQQEAWAIYRQQLRDIPQQSGYPLNVVWPVPPT